ncbi:hypothetical protein [Spirosoma fluviale]|nr:hypothetical protein [Spirosoma fluviale]
MDSHPTPTGVDGERSEPLHTCLVGLKTLLRDGLPVDGKLP